MPAPGPSELTREIARLLTKQREKLLDVSPSQGAIANALGVSQPFVSSALAGRAVLDIEQLDMICRLMGLKIEDVVREAEAAAHNRHPVPDFTVGGVTETANLAASRSKKKADIPAAE